MKLLTKEVTKALPKLYSQEKTHDPMVTVKFFCPWNQWTWYATEGQPAATEDKENDFMFFGLVVGHSTELGYWTLSQLESVRGPVGLGIERDIHWTPKPLSEVRAKHG